MSKFNAAQVLAEAYTLYKKHHDGRGLDFKIAINQVREESEQRGAIKALQEAADEVLDYDPRVSLRGIYAALRNRADRMEGDDAG